MRKRGDTVPDGFIREPHSGISSSSSNAPSPGLSSSPMNVDDDINDGDADDDEEADDDDDGPAHDTLKDISCRLCQEIPYGSSVLCFCHIIEQLFCFSIYQDAREIYNEFYRSLASLDPSSWHQVSLLIVVFLDLARTRGLSYGFQERVLEAQMR
jgi:hypothetical protein